MASIAKLVVSLGANVAGFETDMKRANKNQQKRMEQMEADVKKAGLAMGAAFLAVGAAMTAMVARSTSTADAMQKLSIRTGVSTESLSKYALVAELADVSIEQFGKGINKMQRSLVDASDGLATQQRAFDRLGLSVTDLLKLSPEDQFENIAGSLAELEDITLRNATGQAIFGRSWAELSTMVAGGAEALRKGKEEAESFNLVISQEFADASAQFNDNMTRIGKLSEGTSNAFTEGLLPALLSIQQGFLDMPRSFNVFKSVGEGVGTILKTLATAFVVVKESGMLFGRVLVGAITAVFNAFRAAASPITGLLTSLSSALQSFAAGDYASTLSSLRNIHTVIAAEFVAAVEGMELAAGFLTETFNDELPAAIARVNGFFNSNADVVGTAAVAYRELEEQADASAKGIAGLEAAAKNFIRTQKDSAREIKKYTSALEESAKEQENFNSALQELLDMENPIGRMLREFEKKLAILDRGLKEGKISTQQYWAILNQLTNALGKAAAESEVLAEATEEMSERALEAIRILERSFTSAWENILDGGGDMFDGLAKGFKTLIAGMIHDITTAPLIEELKKVFAAVQGGAGFGTALGGIDWSKIGAAFANIAGVLGGSAIGGGGTGATLGAGIGAAFGSATFSTLLPVLFKSLGSFAGPIGTVIGGIVGGLLGGLFDSDRNPLLEASGFSRANASKSDDDTSIDTVFGTTFIRSRRLDQAGVNRFKESLQQFDSAIASFLNSNQIAAASEALKGWIDSIESKSLNLSELLESRFNTILSTFTGNIQAFVNQAQSLEDRTARLQVAVGAGNIFDELGDALKGRSYDEFLAVIDAFADHTTDITTAFKQVLVLLDQIMFATESLSSFSSSDLSTDFDKIVMLRDETPLDKLTRQSSELFDAIANFAGTPDELFAIAGLVRDIRQGEIAYLMQIESIQKGLTASLQRLRESVISIIEGPKTSDQILSEAEALIAAIGSAGTAEEISALGVKFDQLIRSLSPEDVAANGDFILALIDKFDAASAASLELFKQQALEAAQSTRDLIDGLVDIVDPLSMIASTNERAALALEAIANGGTVSVDDDAAYDQAIIIASGVTEALEFGLNATERALRDGTGEMAMAIERGMGGAASDIRNAIISGFGSASVHVTVNIDPASLTTE